MVPGPAPILLLKLFSVFHTHTHRTVHAALCCPVKGCSSNHMCKQTPDRRPQPNKTPHIFLQLHGSRFCFSPFTSAFFSPLHFVLLTFWKSTRQKLFCQEFLNPLKILIPLFFLPWQSFSPWRRMMAVLHIAARSREKGGFTEKLFYFCTTEFHCINYCNNLFLEAVTHRLNK